MAHVRDKGPHLDGSERHVLGRSSRSTAQRLGAARQPSVSSTRSPAVPGTRNMRQLVQAARGKLPECSTSAIQEPEKAICVRELEKAFFVRHVIIFLACQLLSRTRACMCEKGVAFVDQLFSVLHF